MKIVFHAGSFKTGSSSLQNIMYDNRDILLHDHGILYPMTGLKLSDRSVGVRHSKFPYAYKGNEDVRYSELVGSLVHEISCLNSDG